MTRRTVTKRASRAARRLERHRNLERYVHPAWALAPLVPLLVWWAVSRYLTSSHDPLGSIPVPPQPEWLDR